MPDALLAWTVVTNTAAMHVTSLAAVVVGALLASHGRRALAWRWAWLFFTVLSVVLVSKVAFAGWGIGIRELDFTGFSGHASRSAAVMPVLGWLIGRARGYGAAGAIAGIGWAALVAVSRVVLDAHSVSEALSGYLIGLAAALAMLRAARGMPGAVPVRPLLVLCMALLAPLPGGQPTAHKPGWTTRLVAQIALALSGRERPFTRQDWHAPATRTDLTP